MKAVIYIGLLMMCQYINLLGKGVLSENNEELSILRYKGKEILD